MKTIKSHKIYFFDLNSSNTSVTCVVELPKPLTENSQQLVISLQCDNIGMVCILHVNGSQILWCLQTDVIVTELTICDRIPNGPFSCFDGLVMAGTIRGEIFAFDLNRASLIKGKFMSFYCPCHKYQGSIQYMYFYIDLYHLSYLSCKSI